MFFALVAPNRNYYGKGHMQYRLMQPEAVTLTTQLAIKVIAASRPKFVDVANKFPLFPFERKIVSWHPICAILAAGVNDASCERHY